MSKVLIAVVNARHRMEWASAIRTTWASLVPPDRADVKFFVGRGEISAIADTVELECGDLYKDLPEKVKSIIHWSLKHDYDYMLKVDDDVVINPLALMSSGFDTADFTGHESSPNNQTPYGFCYWLSRKAMEIMKEQPLPPNNNDEAWVANTLLKNGIALCHDGRYRLHYGRRI